MPAEIKSPMKPSQLSGIAKHIEETAQQLRLIAVAISDDNFDVVRVKTWDQMSRATKYLDNFISAAHAALKEARQERGDIPPPPKKEKAGKKPSAKRGGR